MPARDGRCTAGRITARGAEMRRPGDRQGNGNREGGKPASQSQREEISGGERNGCPFRFVSFCFGPVGDGEQVRVRVPPLTGGDVGYVGSAGQRVGWVERTCECDGWGTVLRVVFFFKILVTGEGLERAK